jgi:hypothetical protein
MVVLDALIAFAVLMALMLGWIAVQRAYRRFACRHPEAGPYRTEGQGCVSCASAATCERKPAQP